MALAVMVDLNSSDIDLEADYFVRTTTGTTERSMNERSSNTTNQVGKYGPVFRRPNSSWLSSGNSYRRSNGLSLLPVECRWSDFEWALRVALPIAARRPVATHRELDVGISSGIGLELFRRGLRIVPPNSAGNGTLSHLDHLQGLVANALRPSLTNWPSPSKSLCQNCRTCWYFLLLPIAVHRPASPVVAGNAVSTPPLCPLCNGTLDYWNLAATEWGT